MLLNTPSVCPASTSYILSTGVSPLSNMTTLTRVRGECVQCAVWSVNNNQELSLISPSPGPAVPPVHCTSSPAQPAPLMSTPATPTLRTVTSSTSVLLAEPGVSPAVQATSSTPSVWPARVRRRWRVPAAGSITRPSLTPSLPRPHSPQPSQPTGWPARTGGDQSDLPDLSTGSLSLSLSCLRSRFLNSCWTFRTLVSPAPAHLESEPGCPPVLPGDSRNSSSPVASHRRRRRVSSAT